jgi:hypothetical protein
MLENKQTKGKMNRQESLFAILPRALKALREGEPTEIAVLWAPIYVDEYAEGEHVYAPRVAIEGKIIYPHRDGIKWEIDAVVSPSGTVFYTKIEDTLEAVKRVFTQGKAPAVTLRLVEGGAR